jgi:hypothetical protein
MQTVLTRLTGGIKDKKSFIRGSLKGLSPFKKLLPPLLEKERGIKGVR